VSRKTAETKRLDDGKLKVTSRAAPSFVTVGELLCSYHFTCTKVQYLNERGLLHSKHDQLVKVCNSSIYSYYDLPGLVSMSLHW